MLIDPADGRLVWLLVRSKPKQEPLLAEGLLARDVDVYVPRVLEPRLHARSPKGPVPLFPSYVFARCVAAERFAAVNYCPGAIGIVRFGDLLAAVDDELVAGLRQREGDRGYVVVAEARTQPVKGSRARITRGPLEGLEGIIERYMPARDRVRLLLSLVTGHRSVEVEAANVRVVPLAAQRRDG